MSKKKRHKNKQAKSSCCINYSLVSEIAANYGADTFWLATLFDALTYWSLSPIEILGVSTGVSIPALVVGSTLSLISSFGYAGARKDINLNMSDSDSEDESESTYGSAKTDQIPDLDPAPAPDLEEGKLIPTQKAASGSLSVWQYLKLGGHLISTAGDVAALPIALFSLVSTRSSPPKLAKLLVHCSAALWGGTAAIAPTQSCAKAMRNMNQH